MIAMAVGGRIKEGGSIFITIFKGKMRDLTRRKARRHLCRGRGGSSPQSGEHRRAPKF